jgi:phage baseplate assembly protein gpV
MDTFRDKGTITKKDLNTKLQGKYHTGSLSSGWEKVKKDVTQKERTTWEKIETLWEDRNK